MIMNLHIIISISQTNTYNEQIFPDLITNKTSSNTGIRIHRDPESPYSIVHEITDIIHRRILGL